MDAVCGNFALGGPGGVTGGIDPDNEMVHLRPSEQERQHWQRQAEQRKCSPRNKVQTWLTDSGTESLPLRSTQVGNFVIFSVSDLISGECSVAEKSNTWGKRK